MNKEEKLASYKTFWNELYIVVLRNGRVAKLPKRLVLWLKKKVDEENMANMSRFYSNRAISEKRLEKEANG